MAKLLGFLDLSNDIYNNYIYVIAETYEFVWMLKLLMLLQCDI